jgi:hypothetical protein
MKEAMTLNLDLFIAPYRRRCFRWQSEQTLVGEAGRIKYDPGLTPPSRETGT